MTTSKQAELDKHLIQELGNLVDWYGVNVVEKHLETFQKKVEKGRRFWGSTQEGLAQQLVHLAHQLVDDKWTRAHLAACECGKELAVKRGEYTILASLLNMLQAAAMLHQTHHWQVGGASSYSDHLLFQRLYEESQPFIDEVAERVVGAGSVEYVDAVKNVDVIHMMTKSFYDECEDKHPDVTKSADKMLLRSMTAESMVLGGIETAMMCLDDNTKAITPGTSNLLEGLSDKHEQFTYLLQQRMR